jgi:hypothetical protein
MNALRLIAEILLVEAAHSLRRPAAPSSPTRIYDPYSLKTRSLPTNLQIHPHPRGIPADRVREITGGVLC